MDEDVERLLRDDMHRQRRSFKESLNAAVRTGLMASARRDSEPFEVKAYPMGLLPGFDPTRFNQLADELEIEAVIERMRAFEAKMGKQGRRPRRKAR